MFVLVTKLAYTMFEEYLHAAYPNATQTAAAFI